MENQTDLQDGWEHTLSGNLMHPFPELSTFDREDEAWEIRWDSSYEEQGTDDRCTEPKTTYHWSQDTFFELLTGPSTNFYVGPQDKQYTIPKRLVYHFSDYAQICLEGGFSEAGANAIRLLDVDPGTFQWLWQWLYTGKIRVHRYYQSGVNLYGSERLEQTCRVLCRVHALGERLLFDSRLFSDVRLQMEDVFEEAKTLGKPMPMTPEIVEEVLADSRPVVYGISAWVSLSLRPFILERLCTFDFCTTVDFGEYVDCFERDGAFAAELMAFVADEIKWAVQRWEAEIGWQIDLSDQKKQFAEIQRTSEHSVGKPKERQGIWRVLKVMCTAAGCTAEDLRAFGQLYELNGEIAAEILEYMAAELLWIVERWGEERGEKVDVAAEREEEARIEEEEDAKKRFVQKIMRRQYLG